MKTTKRDHVRIWGVRNRATTEPSPPRVEGKADQQQGGEEPDEGLRPPGQGEGTEHRCEQGHGPSKSDEPKGRALHAWGSGDAVHVGEEPQRLCPVFVPGRTRSSSLPAYISDSPMTRCALQRSGDKVRPAPARGDQE